VRIALIAPPFISVPPSTYGGTELFVAQLAVELDRLGHDVVVYANGESKVPCEVRWLYDKAEWPLRDPSTGVFKNMNHVAWAVADSNRGFDVVHLNESLAVCLSPLISAPAVLTIHHPNEPPLSEIFASHPEVQYVAISQAQAKREPMPGLVVIHHGVDAETYAYRESKQDYLSFLGRIAPSKGAHLAIEVAKRTGIPLKIAGEIQPVFQDYWDAMVRPHLQAGFIEYVGELDFARKSEFLSRSRALLFPIQWEEPFGLVMIEAMACGTPVIAFRRGSVPEVVEHGVTGLVVDGPDELVAAIRALDQIDRGACRERVERLFDLPVMVEGYERVLGALVDGRSASLSSVDRHSAPEPHGLVAG